jgi:hypothetical protein
MLPERIRISVIQEDIDLALRENERACAVYNAIARTYSYLSNIKANDATIRFTDRGERIQFIFTTPQKVTEWIGRFDTCANCGHPYSAHGQVTSDGCDDFVGEDVAPFTFTLLRSHAEQKPMQERDIRQRQSQIRYNLNRKKELEDEIPAQRKARNKRNAERDIATRRGRRIA